MSLILYQGGGGWPFCAHAFESKNSRLVVARRNERQALHDMKVTDAEKDGVKIVETHVFVAMSGWCR